MFTDYPDVLNWESQSLYRGYRQKGQPVEKCHFYFSLTFHILAAVLAGSTVASMRGNSKNGVFTSYRINQPKQILPEKLTFYFSLFVLQNVTS